MHRGAMLPKACLHSASPASAADGGRGGGGGGGASRGSEEQKSFWDCSGMRQRSRAVGKGRRRPVTLGTWAFTRELGLL